RFLSSVRILPSVALVPTAKVTLAGTLGGAAAAAEPEAAGFAAADPDAAGLAAADPEAAAPEAAGLAAADADAAGLASAAALAAGLVVAGVDAGALLAGADPPPQAASRLDPSSRPAKPVRGLDVLMYDNSSSKRPKSGLRLFSQTV